MSKKSDWSAPVSADEAARRAAGRRHYNARRTERKQERQDEIVEMLLDNGRTWGCQAQMARTFGVSESTISRDIKEIHRRGRGSACPVCDAVWDRHDWEDLARRGRVVLTEDGVELPPASPQTPEPAPMPSEHPGAPAPGQPRRCDRVRGP